jgi:hypothetical protein
MATGKRPVISVKRGGVTTGRQNTVRQKERGRIHLQALRIVARFLKIAAAD